MDRRSLHRSIGFVVATTAFVVTAVESQASGAAVHIGVLADRYVVTGQAYDDLDRLEARVVQLRAPLVVLHACAPQATRALRAAVHRFRQSPLDIRVDEAYAGCHVATVVATRAAITSRDGPFGIDDAEVDRYWRELVP